MSARAPRRTFASPMIVTVVASASLGACTIVTKSPTPPPTITVDDGANTGSGSNTANSPPTDPTAVRPPVTNPPMPGPVVAPTPPPPPVIPPAPAPSTRPVADRDYSWSVSNGPYGNCYVSIDVKCPTGKPGMPVPTCNPPPPMTMKCPTEIAASQTVTIMQYKGTTACVIAAPAVTCPPKTMCNPPPPTVVACPK